ncbi:MAG: nucleotidyltransferase family protein [Pseudomonadota bacterium]
MSADVGCIVLAAGSSKRFGSDKRRHQLPSGMTMLEQTLAILQQVFERRVLVLRADDADLSIQFANEWHIINAPNAELGMGHSLAAAMQATQQWNGAVIALADMPWLKTHTLTAIRHALKPDNLVVPFYEGQRGNPVAIGSDYFGRLAALQGDSGARQLMQEFSDRIIQLNVDDAGILQDLDTRP